MRRHAGVFATWFGVLRLYAGAFWISHGIPKFLHADAFMPPNGFMGQMIARATMSTTGPYHEFLAQVVTPNIMVFAELVRLGEVLVGCSLLFGLLTRVGGIFGCFLALNYMAAAGELHSFSTIGTLDAAAFVLSFLMVVTPAGQVFGVDALFRRRPRIERVKPEFVDEP